MIWADGWGGWLWLGAYMICSALALQVTAKFLGRMGITGRNYKGREVANRIGLFLWIALGLFQLFPFVRTMEGMEGLYWIYTAALTVVFVAGWFDDAYGTPQAKGLRGHWNYLLRHKKMTSGLWKVLATLASAAGLVVYAQGPAASSLFVVFLIGLSTNAMNLFDLRPGRALKAFLALSAIIAVLAVIGGAVGAAVAVFMLPIVFGGLLLLPGDVRSRWMLGDTGANFLGFALGAWIVLFCNAWQQGLFFVGFAALQWYAERHSISAAIERQPLLRWLDQLGRARPGE
jgi:UDP-N-acetylmuramyl pentapeptide phosphotransferase/UDP-N-acetylglucosamine-1-phosphate transferase